MASVAVVFHSGYGHTQRLAQSVAAGACYLCPEIVGQILSGGDTLSVMSGTATALTMRVSGREVA